LTAQVLVLLNGSEGRVFGLNFQTVFEAAVFFLNIGVLCFVLAKLLYNPVRNFLAKRSDRIKEQLMHAENETVKVNELKAKYESDIKELQSKKNEILDEARKEAAENSKQIIAEAKAEADNVRDRAAQNVLLEQARVKDEMKQAIISISSAMTEKYLARAMDDESQSRLFDETIEELQTASFMYADPQGRAFAEA